MWVVKQPLPAWRAPVSSTVMKGAPASPARSTASSSLRKLSSLAVTELKPGDIVILDNLLRKAEARTFDALIQAIASALETFTPDECANYLANSGYRRQ